MKTKFAAQQKIVKLESQEALWTGTMLDEIREGRRVKVEDARNVVEGE